MELWSFFQSLKLNYIQIHLKINILFLQSTRGGKCTHILYLSRSTDTCVMKDQERRSKKIQTLKCTQSIRLKRWLNFMSSCRRNCLSCSRTMFHCWVSFPGRQTLTFWIGKASQAQQQIKKIRKSRQRALTSLHIRDTNLPRLPVQVSLSACFHLVLAFLAVLSLKV